jgi:IclR family transcriptional regulator, KDG regulon repressor
VTTVPNTSVDQIFDALHLLGGTPDPVGVADLARALDLPMTTAHRLLVTLYDAGFAERDTTGAKYELGSRAHELVHGLFGHYGIRQASLVFLTELIHRTGETATLDVRVGWLTVRMAGFEGWREIHAAPRIGRTRPLGDTASGRAILAFLDEAEIEGYLAWEGDRSSAPRAAELTAAIDAARDNGFAQMPGDDAGSPELAFPVRHGGVAIAAVAVNGMSSLVAGDQRPDGRLRECGEVVGQLERLLTERPQLAVDPFAHLDHDALSAAIWPATPPDLTPLRPRVLQPPSVK